MSNLKELLNGSEVVSAWMFANTPGYLLRTLSNANEVVRLVHWLRSDREKRTRQAVAYLNSYLKRPVPKKKADPTPWGAAALIVAMPSVGLTRDAREVLTRIAKGIRVGQAQHLLRGLAQRILVDLRDSQEVTLEVKHNVSPTTNYKSDQSSVTIVRK